jgi:hypothetical protein
MSKLMSRPDNDGFNARNLDAMMSNLGPSRRKGRIGVRRLRIQEFRWDSLVSGPLWLLPLP